MSAASVVLRFFFNDTATTEIYTLSLHDALPIWSERKRYIWWDEEQGKWTGYDIPDFPVDKRPDYKAPDDAKGMDARSEEHTSDSSHANISYAVFCLKKKTTSAAMTVRRPKSLWT